MIIALTGASGNMGECVLNELVQKDEFDVIRILAHTKKANEKLLRKFKKYLNKIEVVYGNLASNEDVRKLVHNANYVIHMGAVIPPLSDKFPKKAIEANEVGTKILIEEIEKIKTSQPKFIHISTVGLYGDRTPYQPFGEVGDPLLISPFDIYALTKMRAEFAVLESNIENWAVIRQTAVLYDKLLFKNISDGLMFHTCFNAPLEWCTARDSGVLIRNILLKDISGKLDSSNFWKHCFNLAGGEVNRVTGYETLDLGFKIIGASTPQFFDTNYNATRNFHGLRFSDGDKLEKLFSYQNESIYDFWKHVLDTHKYFSLARIVPKKLLKTVIIKRLLKDNNAALYWVKHNDEARIHAYFGNVEKFEDIPKKRGDFPLFCENRFPNIEEKYDEIRKNPTYLEHGFDLHKPLSEITIDDLKNVAEGHGGALVSKEFNAGEVYKKVLWKDQDGNVFEARPYTVLCCGHWHNISYEKYAWDFDRLAKKDKIYAQVWYKAHKEDENNYYYFDENFNAREEKIK